MTKNVTMVLIFFSKIVFKSLGREIARDILKMCVRHSVTNFVANDADLSERVYTGEIGVLRGLEGWSEVLLPVCDEPSRLPPYSAGTRENCLVAPRPSRGAPPSPVRRCPALSDGACSARPVVSPLGDIWYVAFFRSSASTAATWLA